MNSRLALGEPIKLFEISMISLEKRLRDIGFPMTHEHLCEIILGSLLPLYHGFLRLSNSIAEEWHVQMMFALLKEAKADIEASDPTWTKTGIKFIPKLLIKFQQL